MDNQEDLVEGCGCSAIHKDVIEKVSKRIPPQNNLYDLAELFKVLGDLTRVKILSALYESEMCVCDIAYMLKMNQSAISHQLRVLKQAKLVKYRKEGKIVYYSTKDSHVKRIMGQGLAHVNE